MNFFSKEGLKYKKFGASAPSSRGTRRDLGTRSLHRIHPLTMSLSLFSPAKLQRRLDWIRHQSEPFFPGTQVLCYTSATRRVLLLCIVVGTAQRGCRDACFMTVVLPLFFFDNSSRRTQNATLQPCLCSNRKRKAFVLKKNTPFFFLRESLSSPTSTVLGERRRRFARFYSPNLSMAFLSEHACCNWIVTVYFFF